MKGCFDEQGKLVFEIELIANDGTSIRVDTLFDTGFTGWIANITHSCKAQYRDTPQPLSISLSCSSVIT